MQISLLSTDKLIPGNLINVTDYNVETINRVKIDIGSLSEQPHHN